MRIETSINKDDARKRIEKEDDLINHRMSWCVGSNTFLLAALTFAANGHQISPVHLLIRELIPVAGLFLSFSFMISIIAAYNAIWNWRSNSDIPGRGFVFSPTIIAFFGSIASITAPAIFITIWVSIIHADYISDPLAKVLPYYRDLSRHGKGELLFFCINIILILLHWFYYFFQKEYMSKVHDHISSTCSRVCGKNSIQCQWVNVKKDDERCRILLRIPKGECISRILQQEWGARAHCFSGVALLCLYNVMYMTQYGKWMFSFSMIIVILGIGNLICWFVNIDHVVYKNSKLVAIPGAEKVHSKIYLFTPMLICVAWMLLAASWFMQKS